MHGGLKTSTDHQEPVLDDGEGGFEVSAYLINHLRIPGGVPNEEGLSYLERVESIVRPYGGRWLPQGDVQVVEGAWPGSVVLMEFRTMAQAQN